jgi:hypothetical protein
MRTSILKTAAALIAAGAIAPALAAAPAADFGDPQLKLAPGQTVALASPELYVVASGGIGDEERAAIESQAGRYSMRMIFSETNGQYVVADRVSLSKRGTEVLRVTDAGPLLYAQVPPGQYALTVSYKGLTQTRNVNVGSKPSDVHLTWPVELD